MDIHIMWTGPYDFEAAKGLTSGADDYGIYQVYGPHSIYGGSVLLYIGKANAQTFGKRLSQEGWVRVQDPRNVQVYVGRLGGAAALSDEEWAAQIDRAEKLLIHAHQPVYNAASKIQLPLDEVDELHVFNWDAYRDLFPEVSGRRYTRSFEDVAAFRME